MRAKGSRVVEWSACEDSASTQAESVGWEEEWMMEGFRKPRLNSL